MASRRVQLGGLVVPCVTATARHKKTWDGR